MLSDLGCRVDIASHGQEAIKMLDKHDLVLVDIGLPDMNGFEGIQNIRQRYDASQLPIVALTVYTGKEEKLACLKAGANAFASKPISLRYLKKMLLTYLNKNHERTNLANKV